MMEQDISKATCNNYLIYIVNTTRNATDDDIIKNSYYSIRHSIREITSAYSRKPIEPIAADNATFNIIDSVIDDLLEETHVAEEMKPTEVKSWESSI